MQGEWERRWKMKNSFILYHSYKRHLELLTNEQRGVLFTAIFDYSESGVVPELEPVVKMAFNFIAEDIDINKQKWEDTVEARSEAGRKGAEARWKKAPSRKKKMAKDGNRILPMAKDGKNAVSVSVSDSVNDSVSDSENNISNDMGKIPKEEKGVEVVDKDLLFLVELYNSLFQKNIHSYKGFEANYQYWKDIHSLDKMKMALQNARLDKFWKNKMTLTILFRRKNTRGENVDYIEDLSQRVQSDKGMVAII